jgi:hypothetical protein
VSAVAEFDPLTPRALPTPDEVMAVVEASGLTTPGLLDLCKLYGMAHRGVDSAQGEMAHFRGYRGWQRDRVERAAQIVAAFVSLDDSANTYLDQIRLSLPASALAKVWWQ